MLINEIINKMEISNKLMEQAVMEKKNKQNIDRLNSIIQEYQNKLDKRVNQVISEMINYSKKISDPPLLPVLRDKKIESQKNVEKPNSYKHRNKSSSQYSQLSFLSDTSLEAQVSLLRNTFKEVESTKIILQPGRQAGNRSIVKPRFAKKIKPDIVPRQIRLNPLQERNAIKAYELEKGVLSLLEKGKIGKDVNIITAFQKGGSILQAQKAIFHQGQERFAEIEGDKSEQIEQSKPQKLKTVDKMQKIFDESWAITMPKDETSPLKINSNIQESRQLKQPPVLFSFQEQIFIKILSFKVQGDSNFRKFLSRHLPYKSDIIRILHELCRLAQKYSIEICYADSAKVLQQVTKMRRLTAEQLFGCISGSSKVNNFKSLKSVTGNKQKIALSFDKMVSSLKFNVERKSFLQYLEKKKAANHILWWAVSRWTVKKHRQLIKQKRRQRQEEYSMLQKQFRQIWGGLEQRKHFQIHLINQYIQGKQDYKDILNIQITKIFNIKNINKYIIYLLPNALDQETINYYYKIMELEEIPNYKERVWFMQVDAGHQLAQSLDISAKLYYSSKTIRKLKKRIKDAPAYFVVSYPSLMNIELAAYLKVPILSGDLRLTLQLQKRTGLGSFDLQMLQKCAINRGRHNNLIELSDEIREYCLENKRVYKYVIKINNINKSRGTALLTAPFSSLPEMYANTALVCQGKEVDEFYRMFMKQGGVVEKYQQGIYFVSVVMEIDANGLIKVVGTFQKVSSGFVNIAYVFPQKRIEHKRLVELSLQIGEKLVKSQHFGTAQITFAVNDLQDIFLEKVQCYSTHLSSALHYYKFLSEGQFNDQGDYMAKIIDTYENEGKEEEVVTFEARSFCYIPFLLHFGLSDRQSNSFFQLCRMGGVSFDLQNKYGATFILLGSIKSSMGLITTAKDKKASVRLMLKSLQFILKQNSHNMSNSTLMEKQIRMKQRENIINVKERLEAF